MTIPQWDRLSKYDKAEKIVTVTEEAQMEAWDAMEQERKMKKA